MCIRDSPHSDGLTFVVEERRAVLQSKRLREQRVVSKLWVQIKRQVRAVERQVVFKRELDFAPDRADQRLHAAPIKTVMYEQKRRAALPGLGDDGLARVHGGGELRHRAAILDLQPIPRARIVRDLARAQMAVEISGERG